MKKKLLVPLILFLSITIAFLVQLKRNAQGEDIKALESALKACASKKFNGAF